MHQADLHRSGSLCVRAGVLFLNLTIAACLAPTALAQHAGFYDHDRSWAHGQQTATGLVPDDYLQCVGNDGPVTNSTPPFGYYTRAGGGGAPNQNYGGMQPRYYTNPSGKRLARGSGCPSHSALYLNGMGGIDPAMIDDTLPNGYTPVYGGGQSQMVNSAPSYPADQNYVSSAPAQPRHYTNGSKPRRVYYNTGGVISGGKVVAPGYYSWYTRH